MNKAQSSFYAWSSRGSLLMLAIWIFISATPHRANAQLPDITTAERPQPEVGDETALTMFPHSAEGRLWVSGQMNFIYQTNPPFHAEYSGPHSFHPNYEKSTGRVTTLYTGLQITRTAEVLVDFEETGGLGLSGAVGIAGFPNLDAVRDPSLSKAPYLSRIMYHGIIPISHDATEGSRGPLSTFSALPSRRLELRVGKFGVTDFFDSNSIGGDSHLQFLNWAIDQNGAYDFTADSRGYTWGALAEYQSPRWGMRFAEALLPGPRNGGPLVWNLAKANSSNVEFELHQGFLAKRGGALRLLSYVNRGNMGIYQVANAQYLEGKVTQPDISNHPLQVTTKYGFGLNFEQVLGANILSYGRFGWNNGKTESWSFTEIDQTFSAGVCLLGSLWRRRNDRAGVAFASNGITGEHARYLSFGGLAFVLGDGGLRYGRESVVEIYYTAHTWRGIYLGPDLQYIANPGYNRLRGPVFVPSFRVHIEL